MERFDRLDLGANTMATIPPVDVRYQDDALTIATWRDLFIEAWWKHGNLEQLRRVRAEHVAFLDRNPGRKAAQIAIVRSIGITLESRDEMTRRYEEMLPRTSAGAVVIPASGFTTSIVRSMITALTLLKKPPYPWKTCETVEQGAGFLAPHLRRDPSESETALARKATEAIASVSTRA